MALPIVLWIDLRAGSRNQQVARVLASRCRVYRETNPEWIEEAVLKLQPRFLILDYDYPDADGLRSLQRTKFQFPALPILMLTEQHSEQLAVWAFRVGVRDYLHSPTTDDELIERVELLNHIPAQHGQPKPRANPLVFQPIPAGACYVADSAKDPSSVRQALPYIDDRLSERISLHEVAETSGLTTFAFSRAFKKELGITFQEYLIRSRIDKAQQLLGNPRLSVTDVAGAAGFGDLSHFIRTFRKYVGSSPSAYRKASFLKGDVDAPETPPTGRVEKPVPRVAQAS